MHQTIVLGRFLAMISAARRICLARPQVSVTLSGVHFMTSFDLVHAVDPRSDVRLVLPAVLEDVVHHPVQERDIAAPAQPDVVICFGRGARKRGRSSSRRSPSRSVKSIDTGCALSRFDPMYNIAFVFSMSLYEFVIAP
jgi:hypothetical protein